MKGVEFTRDMRPYARGATALLPDALATRIIAEGAAKPYAFPEQPFAHGAVAQAPAPEPDALAHGYKTKRAR
jgi:hypothetical protein